ncbi:MAG TPA: enoyl-CoA hydratase [Acidimicrobiales bacterium]|nr:enoyl-CoA hydratase [Acidimicrobiales bacterium]
MPVLLNDISDGVAVVTLNRPERRNALSGELLAALRSTMGDLADDESVSVVILTGADPAFCAGLDLKELGSAGGGLLGNATESDAADVRQPSTPWRPLGKPLIGAVNGVAVTGGFELALQCDFLIASDRAAFGDTHARVGLLPGWGLSVLLPQAIGVRRAKEMSLTGNFLSAEEALHFGLVNHVVPHDELLPFARRIAADIAGNDQAAVRALRDEYDAVTRTTVDEGLRIEAERSRAWQRGGAGGDVEARRRAIIERGRTQV